MSPEITVAERFLAVEILRLTAVVEMTNDEWFYQNIDPKYRDGWDYIRPYLDGIGAVVRELDPDRYDGVAFTRSWCQTVLDGSVGEK